MAGGTIGVPTEGLPSEKVGALAGATIPSPAPTNPVKTPGSRISELQLYSPLVSPGSYIVVEDTHFDSVPVYPDFGPVPMAAVNAFLAQGGSDLFEQDVSREAMVMTFNPGGWLRRKAEKSYPE